MKRCLVVGRPNAGKTTFVLNFAAFLGARVRPGGQLSPSGARAVGAEGALPDAWRVDPRPHTTSYLQAIQVRGRGLGAARTLDLLDSPGLDDGVHPDPAVRAAMAQTLLTLRSADLVLHVVDAATVGIVGTVAGLGEIDRQIARLAPLRAVYALLANKLDLPWARVGVQRMRAEFPDRTVIAVSAQKRSGFKEIRALVQHCL